MKKTDLDDGSSIVQTFRERLSKKREARQKEYDGDEWQHPTEHAYSLHKAKKRAVRASDVDRHFIDEYEKFTTVLVTYCVERKADESVSEHANQFYPSDLSKARWNVFNRGVDTQEWAAVRLLAPSKPDGGTPTPEFTHGHTVALVQGWHDCEKFEPLRHTFLTEVDGATKENNPLDEMIKVEHHTSAEIEPPKSVKRQNLDEERGVRTSASGEVGANLPLLRARNSLRKRDASAKEWAAADATDCPDWIERWCANLWHGIDGEPDTRGLTRYGELGNFTEIAESVKQEEGTARGYHDDDDENGDNRDGKRENDLSVESESESVKAAMGVLQTEDEREFVRQYIQSDAPKHKDTIIRNIHKNTDEFDGMVETALIIEAIRSTDEEREPKDLYA